MPGGRRAAFCPWNKQSEPGNLILTASTGLGAVPSFPQQPRLPAAGCAVCRSGSQDAVTACRSSAEPLASCCRVTAVSKNALVLPPCSGGALAARGGGSEHRGAAGRAVPCRAELCCAVPSCSVPSRPRAGGAGSAPGPAAPEAPLKARRGQGGRGRRWGRGRRCGRLGTGTSGTARIRSAQHSSARHGKAQRLGRLQQEAGWGRRF